MKRVVCLDAGHGGHDPGTVRKNTEEEDIALDLVDRIGRYLRLLSKTGDMDSVPQISTIFTRRTDEDTPINARTLIASRADADLLLSIHVNSTLPQREGALCIVSKDGKFIPRSTELGDSILEGLATCGLKNRSVFPDKKPYINYNQLGVLHGVCEHMPAVLVEVGNIRNDHDYQLLLSAKSLEVMAIAAARAVVEWFGIRPRTDLLTNKEEV